MVRVRTECRHGFTALTVVLVTDARGLASGARSAAPIVTRFRWAQNANRPFLQLVATTRSRGACLHSERRATPSLTRLSHRKSVPNAKQRSEE
jgi:hypothetical protein